MDWNFAQIHLSLNHFPIVGIFFSIFALAWGMATRNYPTIRVGLSFIILSALLCIPVYLSGEPAEHQIEHLAGVSAEALEAHEDAALGAFVVVLATGTLAALALILRRMHKTFLARPLEWGSFLLSLIAVVLFVRVAHYGGLIRHSELRSGLLSTEVTESIPDSME